MKLAPIGVAVALATFPATGPAQEPESKAVAPLKFERVVIDNNFPGGYQVEVADVNGDGKPDVVGVGGGTCAISSATADLDGDGKAEVAIAYDFAMNEPRRGKLLLAIQGAKPDDPWTFRPVADVPSIHRLRWGIVPSILDAVGHASLEKKPGLFVASIFGPSARPPIFDQEPARLCYFEAGSEPKSGRWSRKHLGEAPVCHAIDVIQDDDRRFSAVLAASNLGVSSYRIKPAVGEGPPYRRSDLVSGAPGDAPKKGSSEVHLGRLKDGRRFLATVEPWHGTDVAVYLSESPKPLKFGPRTVIDSSMKEGHALWVADVDGDGDDEVFAGYRGGGGGVLVFDRVGTDWVKAVLDPAVTAQDLRGGDLDGDGRPDVVAIGGQSHNVVWYRPVPAAGKARE